MAAVDKKIFDDSIHDIPAQTVSKMGNGTGWQAELEPGPNETELASIERVERVYRFVLSRATK